MNFLGFLLVCILSLSQIVAGEHGESKSKSSSEHGDGKEGGKSNEIPKVGPMLITIIKDNEVKGYIKLAVNLYAEEEFRSELEPWIPRLQNAYMIHLGSILGNFWITGETPNIQNLKNILQRITDQTIGSNKIKAVLINSYYFSKAEVDAHRSGNH